MLKVGQVHLRLRGFDWGGGGAPISYPESNHPDESSTSPTARERSRTMHLTCICGLGYLERSSRRVVQPLEKLGGGAPGPCGHDQWARLKGPIRGEG